MSDVVLRQIEMLRLIPQHKSITAQKIREKLADIGYETTERTVQRDLNELSRRFPLVCEDTERPFKWHWAESADEIDLPKIESEILSSKETVPHSEKSRSAMKIFLSYGHDENSRLVERIKADLEKPENGGHECWFDTSGIKAGDDWRHAITNGIQQSNWVLSFISRHACREWEQNGARKQGVCLDELAIAIGTRGGIVKTVLVESPTDPDALNPPLTVSHIQYLDMHEWKKKEAEGNEAFEAWYAERFAEILRVINDPLNQKFAGDIEFLREKLQPLDNAARIGELMANGFVGREWLRDEIVHWLNHELQQKVFCLTGEPGFGKSAMAAWLAYQNRPEVIAAHFCQYNQPNFCDPGRVIRSIAFQIATRLPDFRLHLINAINAAESQPSEDGQSPLNKLKPAELFQTLIADAAYLSIDGGRHRHLVIIDALDEAGKELVEFLAQNQGKLPGWLALFVTSRPNDAGVRQHLSMLNPHYRDVSDGRNQADAKAWISQWLGSRHIEGQQQADIMEPLLSKSEGNFHYLRTFRHMVEQDPTLLERPQEYPQGLDSLYLTFFERQFKDIEAYRQWQAPFLTLIAAARRPLSLELAREVLELGKVDWKTKVLQPLGSLFKISGEKDAEMIVPFHKSMRDWLKDDSRSGDYFVDEEEGHFKLGQGLWDQFCDNPEELSDYGIRELPYHLLKIGEKSLNKIIPDEHSWRKSRERAIEISNRKEIRYHEDEIWLRLICNRDCEILGDDSTETAESCKSLAVRIGLDGNDDLERAKEAEILAQKALTIYQKIYGDLHEKTADTLTLIADFLRLGGRFSEAETFLRKALNIYKEILGFDEILTRTTLFQLSASLLNQGKPNELKSLYEEVFNFIDNTLGPNHAAIGAVLEDWASVHEINNDDTSEMIYRRAISFNEATFGADHKNTLRSLYKFVTFLIQRRRNNSYSEAENLLRRLIAALPEIPDESENPFDGDLSSCLGMLTDIMLDENNPSHNIFEAEQLIRQQLLLQERIKSYESSRPFPNPCQNGFISSLLAQLGRVLDLQGKSREAEENYRRALENTEKHLIDFPDDVSAEYDVKRALDDLAHHLQTKGDFIEAEKLLRKSLALTENRSSDETDILNALSITEHLQNLAGNLMAQERFEEAEMLLRRSLTIHEEKYDPDLDFLGDNINTIFSTIENLNACLSKLERQKIEEDVLKRDFPKLHLKINSRGSIVE